MWVPLHLHSQYSILDGACPIEKIARKAALCKMPAVALTDHGNMHGAIDFYKACRAEGVKPILGCEVYVAPTSRFDKKKDLLSGRTNYHLTLLAKNDEGYHNLARLSSLGYLEGFYYHPRVDKELLKRHAGGIICLSGCLSGEVSSLLSQGKESQAIEVIKWYRDLFQDDYYLELQRHEMSVMKVSELSESWLLAEYEQFIGKQKKATHRLIELSREMGIKCVATNDTHYMEADDYFAHEILINIQSGEPVEMSGGERVANPKRRVYASREVYFKSCEEMAQLFSDVPEALSNSVEIAEKCTLTLDFGAKHYPLYIPPALAGKSYTKEEQILAASDFLRQLCEKAIPHRYTQEALLKVGEKYPGKDPLTIVRERLEGELKIIISKEMCDYLLIVWDFIHWAKENGIPVGPGRGSGAGSIILYLIGVTDIEPLRFDLFFERFINPERISYPDIDVDICMAKREEVINYTVGKYGKENVAQIITFGTMKARMAIKDVGRVLSVPLSKVNAIARLVPEDPNMTLSKALEIDVDLHALYMNDPEAKRVIDIAKKLEGSIRNTSIHAAGIIIAAEPLINHIPMCLAKDSQMAATQYSMKPVEAVGMLKIDFLGLKTLTAIKVAVDAIRQSRGEEIDWVNLPLDDMATFRLLHQGRTLGVFQMESAGMQDLARQLQPDRFEEIIAIGALYRPGPMEMIPSFVQRKHKREPIEYDHPLLKPILAETYGIMVYQEQVMQIATQLALYSLGEGDVLRRAMGKKDMAQMAKEREKFRSGAVKNGISDEVATAIFDKVERFAAYGFNKSHAAAYGYLTYVTAYLKAHFQKEWMASLMTVDSDDVSKVAKFIRECHALAIPILPPDINEAGQEFVATESGIRFAMSAIKGVGEGIVELILKERKKNGPFQDCYSFFKRIELKKIGRKTIEVLVDAGCFDAFGWSRDALKLSIEEMYDCALREQEEATSGVLTFFSMMGDDGGKRFSTPPPVPTPTPRHKVLKRERELLGFFLTGHPMDDYRALLERLSVSPLAHSETLPHQAVFRTAFIIESLDVKIASKTQKKFAVLTISDGLESYEVPIWSELYEEKGSLLVENQLLYAVMQVDKREESVRLSCPWFDDLTKVNEAMIKSCDATYDRLKARSGRPLFSKPPQNTPPATALPLILRADLKKLSMSNILKINEILHAFPGITAVKVDFYDGERPLSSLILDKRRRVTPSPALFAALANIGVQKA